MDKLRPILKQLQKHHFWLLCVVVMIAGLLGWVMASGRLSLAYDTNKSKIVGKFSNLDGILKTENHPNSKWTEALGEINKQEKDIVRKAWETVYDEQKQHLAWPPELGQDFIDFVAKNPPDDQWTLDFLTRYQDRILQSEFPRLAAIVGVRPDEKSTAPASGGSGDAPAMAPPGARPAAAGTASAGAADAPDYSFSWEAASQQEVRKALYFPQRPTAAQVRQTQEDIWVYQALLRIVAAMNKDLHVPVVKRLAVMEIGKPAAKAFQEGMKPGHIEIVEAPGAEGGAAAAAEAPPPAAAEGEGAAPAIDEGRYVDDEGKPLPAGEAAGKQFKRLPVHLRLIMDQRQINKLLVECANSPLPVEVRQLRVGSKENRSSNDAASRAGSGAVAHESYDTPVELEGIIYLYNPPDASKLGAPPAAGAPAAAPAG